MSRQPPSGPAPRVSVVIPTKNRLALLRIALRSVLEQTLSDIEVIVVDDGSRDGTSDELRGIEDARLVVLAHATSSGVARARNDAIERASAPWIAFLDDDDFWAPQKLARQLEAAEHAGTSLSCTGALRIGSRGEVLEQVGVPPHDDLERRLLGSNIVGSPSLVMAAAGPLRAVGGFDERLSVLADWDLWLRVAQHGPLATVDEPLAAIVEHGANMQRADILRVAAELDHMRTRHLKRMRELGCALGSPTLSVWMASNLLHERRRRDAARWYLDAARRGRAPAHVVRAAVALIGGQRVAERIRSRRAGPPPETPPWVRSALSGSESMFGAVAG